MGFGPCNCYDVILMILPSNLCTTLFVCDILLNDFLLNDELLLYYLKMI